MEYRSKGHLPETPRNETSTHSAHPPFTHRKLSFQTATAWRDHSRDVSFCWKVLVGASSRMGIFCTRLQLFHREVLPHPTTTNRILPRVMEATVICSPNGQLVSGGNPMSRDV